MSLSKAQIQAPGWSHQVTLVEGLTRTQIVQYAGASGDFNPLHTDEVFATQVAGYPSVFAHGMLTMGMTGRMVTDLVGVDNLVGFGGRFTSQVWPGDTLTATATCNGLGTEEGKEVANLEVVTTNQDGTVVFKGHASATYQD